MVRKTRENVREAYGDCAEMDDESLKKAQDAGRTALENVDIAEIDALLDEIDDVLESDAAIFVDTFVQVNGQ